MIRSRVLRGLLLTAVLFGSTSSYACEDLIVEGACFDREQSNLAEIEECADRGDMDALMYLHVAYRSGDLGIASNPQKSMEYMQKAADLGCVEAHLALGDAYLQGFGVPPSITKAAEHYEVAAGRGNPMGHCAMGAIYHSGQLTGVPNYDKAFEHVRTAAIGGDPKCTFLLSLYYYNGDGTAQNLERARFYIDKAVSMNFPDAVIYKKQMFGEE